MNETGQGGGGRRGLDLEAEEIQHFSDLTILSLLQLHLGTLARPPHTTERSLCHHETRLILTTRAQYVVPYYVVAFKSKP